MIIEYEWVSREPFLEYNSHNVESWLLQLSAKGWLTESGKIASSGDPEAIAYRSSTAKVPLGGRRHVTGYSSGDITSMSEAFRKIEKWDRSLLIEVSGELYSPRAIPNWNNSTLQVSGELDL
tara:strand:- start:147 stop:512 length:366 start_codon:yes stop_codon:yes gene_type:complete